MSFWNSSHCKGYWLVLLFLTLKLQSYAIWYKIQFQIIFYLCVSCEFLKNMLWTTAAFFNDHQCNQIFIFHSYKFIPIKQIVCTTIPSIAINACLLLLYEIKSRFASCFSRYPQNSTKKRYLCRNFLMSTWLWVSAINLHTEICT